MKKAFVAALAFGLLVVAPVAVLAGDQMPMSMSDAPAHFKPTLSIYTAKHEFLVKLTSLPSPIPYQKYFTLRFAIYDGHHPDKRLPDAKLALSAGMHHGMKHGFAHGMQSAPKIAGKDGTFTVDGMYFHMMGKWTLNVTVTQAGRHDVAYFDLPCCGK
jgi:hypothetical protein